MILQLLYASLQRYDAHIYDTPSIKLALLLDSCIEDGAAESMLLGKLWRGISFYQTPSPKFSR